MNEEFRKKYLELVGLDRNCSDSDSDGKFERALDTAHRIREFEISLYWQRTTYFWGFQAAFLATIAIAIEDGEKFGALGKLFCAGVSLLAMTLAFFWLLMAKGAKFWHDNWERHVDLLEDNVTGRLYKVYPRDVGQTDRPYSVTKLNSLSILAFIVFWFLSFFLFSFLLCSDAVSQSRTVFGASLLVLGIGLFAAALFVMQIRGSNLFEGVRMGPPAWKVFDRPEYSTSPSHPEVGANIYVRTPFDRKANDGGGNQ